MKGRRVLTVTNKGIRKTHFRVHMTRFYNTSLGRQVYSEREWLEDFILKILYDTQTALFSDETPISLRLLAESAAIEPRRAKRICQYLRSKGLIERSPVPRDEDFFRLSAEGIRFVEIHTTRLE